MVMTKKEKELYKKAKLHEAEKQPLDKLMKDFLEDCKKKEKEEKSQSQSDEV